MSGYVQSSFVASPLIRHGSKRQLPGTIFTAAKEIEAAGGKALPVPCDIRFEDQIINAINKAGTYPNAASDAAHPSVC